jgi:hypothetical protein
VSDPISRLQFARQEIDRVFGPGYAVRHPEVVCALMQSAASDYAAQLRARRTGRNRGDQVRPPFPDHG